MEWAYLPQVPGGDAADGREGVLDLEERL